MLPHKLMSRRGPGHGDGTDLNAITLSLRSLYHSLNSYQSVVSDIVTNGCYSDRHVVLALRAVVQKPI